jgi:hypothetical protein
MKRKLYEWSNNRLDIQHRGENRHVILVARSLGKHQITHLTKSRQHGIYENFLWQFTVNFQFVTKFTVCFKDKDDRVYTTEILWKHTELHDIRVSLRSFQSDGHEITCFCGTWRLITLLTTAHYWTLSSVSSIQFTISHQISLRSITVVSSHIWQDFLVFSCQVSNHNFLCISLHLWNQFSYHKASIWHTSTVR